ncbi:MAG: D-alanyl-D-alanine carboxypeptidase/D-alanyl-D-alanine-endopeptidase [Pseudomonadota bacterium]|nr:D-alanyl-D-alanine carboxypeptidase/D-alanyl-D-alanine-endopeptidase [Pseudomonadota bacterium]
MYRNLPSLFLLLLSTWIYGATSEQDLEAIIQPLSKKATFAMIIANSQSGEIIFESNPNIYLQPASTMKVITAVAAYSTLAPTSPFQTTMQVLGEQSFNSLRGDLLIQGGGDPNLQEEDIDSFIKSLQTHHIEKIEGDILIQSNHFDNRIQIPGTVWEEVLDCYAAPTSSLTLSNNCFTIRAEPKNQQVILENPNTLQPIENKISLQNFCAHDFEPSTHHTVFTEGIHLDHDPFSYPQKLSGCWKKEEPALELKLSTRNPAQQFAQVLSQKLHAAHITYSGKIKHVQQYLTKKKLLWEETIASSSLENLIEEMLVFSNNRIANHLFKQIGFTYFGHKSSWEMSEQGLLKALAKHGIVDEEASIADGAGLSRNNRISANLLYQCLQAIYQEPSMRKLIPLFAQPGEKGTLNKRLHQTHKAIYAKTGYLKGVISLAGFIDPYGPDPRTFVLLINGSKVIDKDYEKIEDDLFQVLEQF